jgi:ABC-2 type transport system permease protein
VFVLLFASSAFFPRQTMTGWFRRLADLNPISHLVEGMRELDINGWSVASAGKALGIPVAIGVVGIVLSLLALRRRLEAR